MPQCHIQKHPDLKNLIFTTQMRYLIQRDYMETSTGKARRLAPVLEQVMSRVVSRTTKPEYKEAIRSRFWVNFVKLGFQAFFLMRKRIVIY